MTLCSQCGQPRDCGHPQIGLDPFSAVRNPAVFTRIDRRAKGALRIGVFGIGVFLLALALLLATLGGVVLGAILLIQAAVALAVPFRSPPVAQVYSFPPRRNVR